jgi:hypothetical protein
VRTGLTFLTTHKNAKYLMDPAAITGLRLAATDIGWTFGTGPAVEGNGEALMMSLTGRPKLAELSGDGGEQLAARLAI